MSFLLDTDHISILQKQSGPEYASLIARIVQVRRADFAFCIISFHEQVLGCNTYLAQAKTSADMVRGYQMFDRVPSAFAAARMGLWTALLTMNADTVGQMSCNPAIDGKWANKSKDPISVSLNHNPILTLFLPV
jgi:hypothetical protein